MEYDAVAPAAMTADRHQLRHIPGAREVTNCMSSERASSMIASAASAASTLTPPESFSMYASRRTRLPPGTPLDRFPSQVPLVLLAGSPHDATEPPRPVGLASEDGQRHGAARE